MGFPGFVVELIGEFRGFDARTLAGNERVTFGRDFTGSLRVGDAVGFDDTAGVAHLGVAGQNELGLRRPFNHFGRDNACAFF